jgi:hypothetical protein
LISKELDKFYTKPDIAKLCADIFWKHLEDKTSFVVEPSAGAGVFAPYVSLMLDLLPEGENIKQQDFLTFDSFNYANYLGNPPFGKNSSLAKAFFNHAAKGKGYIGFILPRTFRKVSIQNSIDLHFHLVEEVLLPENSFTLEGKNYPVPCVFQVWKYSDVKREKIKLPTTHPDFSFVSSEEADFSLRRVGGNAGKLNDHNNFSPSSNYFIKGAVKDVFEELEEDFRAVAKDTAGNPSLSKGEIVRIYSDFIKNQK